MPPKSKYGQFKTEPDQGGKGGKKDKEKCSIF
eukprot:CAMPEP_0114590902 /NCGR_PEP_ID=MMETSP0125-20121206/13059_1 /TAXON_ID=485358 ORGANISM="Aristerostoma sp., Strain ATCC 50986" /NCGR_SAMPLE_ID=MMETSP0125 /ASSEMBLY_ACC=CAM_ASM_000245 /LENGTH=31 /DNA_ID= /DNA_START= /DNA_END= /DNA_ORIENTATION=